MNHKRLSLCVTIPGPQIAVKIVTKIATVGLKCEHTLPPMGTALLSVTSQPCFLHHYLHPHSFSGKVSSTQQRTGREVWVILRQRARCQMLYNYTLHKITFKRFSAAEATTSTKRIESTGPWKTASKAMGNALHFYKMFMSLYLIVRYQAAVSKKLHLLWTDRNQYHVSLKTNLPETSTDKKQRALYTFRKQT